MGVCDTTVFKNPTLRNRVCTVIENHSPQLYQKHLCTGVECRDAERNWLVRFPHKVARRSCENWELFHGGFVEPSVIQMGDSQTFRPIRVATNLSLYSFSNAVARFKIVLMKSRKVKQRRKILNNVFASLHSLISLASLTSALSSQTIKQIRMCC